MATANPQPNGPTNQPSVIAESKPLIELIRNYKLLLKAHILEMIL